MSFLSTTQNKGKEHWATEGMCSEKKDKKGKEIKEEEKEARGSL
jgi:hypothetical protein